MKNIKYPAEENPFILRFGSVPPMYIEPTKVVDDIVSGLISKYTTDNCFIITGVRGCGKTVTLTDIVDRIRKRDEYIVVRIPSAENILVKIVGQLYDDNLFVKEFIKTNLNLSKFGIGINVEKIEPASDIYVSMLKIMDVIKKNDKKLLVAIDEVSKSKDMIEFGKEFNTLSSEGYPIYLLMTGLPENVTLLEDTEDLTFFRRAAKKALEPLNLTLVRKTYADVFHVDTEEAHKLATLTKGYATAYEILGQILWNNQSPEITESVLKEYDELLESKVYASIWKALSEKEKMYLRCMTEEETLVADILKRSGKSASEFSQYRMRLARKGLVDISNHGRIGLVLPRFNEFVKTITLLETI